MHPRRHGVHRRGDRWSALRRGRRAARGSLYMSTCGRRVERVALVEIGDEPDVGGLRPEHLAGGRARRWAVDPTKFASQAPPDSRNGVGKEACSEHDEIRPSGMTWNSPSPSVRSQASKARVMANPPMPTPMPTGGRIQSVAVGLTRPFVFRRRSQTGPVRLRMLSGNAVYRVKRYRGFESLSLRVSHTV